MDSDEMQGCETAIRDCKLYKIIEVAEILGVTKPTVRNYIKKGLINAINAEGVNTRISGGALKDFLSGKIQEIVDEQVKTLDEILEGKHL